MHKFTTDNLITLASASPQRARLLRDVSLPFQVLPQDVDESLSGGTIEEEVERIALKKAESCLSDPGKSRWILGVDTVVGVDSVIYGKPSSMEDAERTLSAIQGRTHIVASGLALIDSVENKTGSLVCTTKVEFRPMTKDEISWYAATGEWQGAAGGYRIQQRGSLFIHSIEGSYHNIVGLPLEPFYGMLCWLNYPFS